MYAELHDNYLGFAIGRSLGALAVETIGTASCYYREQCTRMLCDGECDCPMRSAYTPSARQPSMRQPGSRQQSSRPLQDKARLKDELQQAQRAAPQGSSSPGSTRDLLTAARAPRKSAAAAIDWSSASTLRLAAELMARWDGASAPAEGECTDEAHPAGPGWCAPPHTRNGKKRVVLREQKGALPVLLKLATRGAADVDAASALKEAIEVREESTILRACAGIQPATAAHCPRPAACSPSRLRSVHAQVSLLARPTAQHVRTVSYGHRRPSPCASRTTRRHLLCCNSMCSALKMAASSSLAIRGSRTV